MAGHLRQHSFTGNTDHDFTGLQPNQLLKLNSSSTAIESSSIVGLGAVTGTGTSNYITKWNSTGSGLTNSLIYDDGTNVGINTTTPAEKIHISSGTLRINDTGSTYGAGKLAVSDANGSISFSSTTSLGLVTSAGTVNKYSTTLTTPTAGVTNTITHNLGTTDITVTLWLVTTGDMTSARITNRQTNSVDVIFAAAPGENVRVVVTG